jgi:hypothetical protein
VKTHHSILAAALLLFSALGPGAAPAPLRLAVDRKGFLRVPAASLHRMGIKAAANGLVCIQFPFSVLAAPKPPPSRHGASRHGSSNPGVERSVPADPPRVWAPLARDGSLALGKTRLIPGSEYVPGAPGTVYFASGQKGRLVLHKPAHK